jgi:hypothetical protein
MRGAPDCIGRDGETATTVEKLCMTGASLVENLTPKIFLSSDRVKIDGGRRLHAAFRDLLRLIERHMRVRSASLQFPTRTIAS